MHNVHFITQHSSHPRHSAPRFGQIAEVADSPAPTLAPAPSISGPPAVATSTLTQTSHGRCFCQPLLNIRVYERRRDFLVVLVAPSPSSSSDDEASSSSGKSASIAEEGSSTHSPTCPSQTFPAGGRCAGFGNLSILGGGSSGSSSHFPLVESHSL